MTSLRYVSIEGQGHFFTIYFPGFVFFVLYKATISGERLHYRTIGPLVFIPYGNQIVAPKYQYTEQRLIATGVKQINSFKT